MSEIDIEIKDAITKVYIADQLREGSYYDDRGHDAVDELLKILYAKYYRDINKRLYVLDKLGKLDDLDEIFMSDFKFPHYFKK
jgi:hypothetical protein